MLTIFSVIFAAVLPILLCFLGAYVAEQGRLKVINSYTCSDCGYHARYFINGCPNCGSLHIDAKSLV